VGTFWLAAGAPAGVTFHSFVAVEPPCDSVGVGLSCRFCWSATTYAASAAEQAHEVGYQLSRPTASPDVPTSHRPAAAGTAKVLMMSWREASSAPPALPARRLPVDCICVGCGEGGRATPQNQLSSESVDGVSPSQTGRPVEPLPVPVLSDPSSESRWQAGLEACYAGAVLVGGRCKSGGFHAPLRGPRKC